MDSILRWGIDLITVVQQVRSPLLDGLFKAITFLGDEEAYLLILPLLFWCVDWRMGTRVGAIFLLSTFVNVGLKDVLKQPRPFDLEPSVAASCAEGYGLPSGHSQGAVVLWGAVAAWARKRWVWAVALLLMLLIGFSRIYLGVHFPTDVFVGWVLGALLLGAYLLWGPGVERWLARLPLWTHLLLGALLPPLLLATHPVKDSTAAMATLCGLGVGVPLMARFAPLAAPRGWWERLARYVLGLAVTLLLYIALKALFPGEESGFYLPFRFLRFALLGLWVSLGAPWLFRVARLSRGAEDTLPGALEA